MDWFPVVLSALTEVSLDSGRDQVNVIAAFGRVGQCDVGMTSKAGARWIRRGQHVAAGQHGREASSHQIRRGRRAASIVYSAEKVRRILTWHVKVELPIPCAGVGGQTFTV